MEDIFSSDEQNGIKFVWNTLPSTRSDATKIVVPVGFHYNPIIKNENLSLLEYEPLKCRCGSIISPLFNFSAKAKVWECPFCRNRNTFPKSYSDFMSDENLPAELFKENSTVEYKLNLKQANAPIFIFLIDTAILEEELNQVKDSIQEIIETLPQECQIGIITYGRMVNVIELGSTDFPISYALNGEKSYKSFEIQELLGLLLRNSSSKTEGTFVNASHRPKFIMPVSEVSFFVNSFLDDLQPEGWTKEKDKRDFNCVGLAINTAISLLESYGSNECSRIELFMGGPGSIGEGKIVGTELKETIRNFLDFEKKNPNTKYYKEACDFYEKLAQRAVLSGITIDIYSCCLNQVGLYEMKNMAAKTGGYIIFTDSFSTMIFKDSFRKIFELDEKGNLKMNFKGKMHFNCTNNYKISGALGHLFSLNKKTPLVSDLIIGEGNTIEWYLGSINESSTYTLFLDCNENSKENNNNKLVIFQILTTYVSGDRSWRLRVSTFSRRISNPLETQNAMNEIGNSFDQEAATVLIARLCVDNSFKGQDSKESLKWIDKTLIHLMTKFAKYTKENPNTFRLTQKFNYFPQFIFYLRRSSFIQSFNESPDESTYYKYLLLGESVENCIIMIQPLLFEYTAENPNKVPVFLDLNSLKSDCVLLLDTFFHVVIWHGVDVVKWREEGFQDQEGYENIKEMLEEPQEYAQNILEERIPVPKFVSCDYGSGQERLLKYVVNPSSDSKNKLQEEGFFSDDVDLKIFMESLKRLAVSS